jgi:hypothetical protein
MLGEFGYRLESRLLFGRLVFSVLSGYTGRLFLGQGQFFVARRRRAGAAHSGFDAEPGKDPFVQHDPADQKPGGNCD